MAKPQTELLDPAKRNEVLEFELKRIEQVRASPLEEIVRWLRAKEYNFRTQAFVEVAAPPADEGAGMWGLGKISGTTETYRNLIGELEQYLVTRKGELSGRTKGQGGDTAPDGGEFVGGEFVPDDQPAPEPNPLEQELINSGVIDPDSKKGSK